jgi:hypothetical protein
MLQKLQIKQYRSYPPVDCMGHTISFLVHKVLSNFKMGKDFAAIMKQDCSPCAGLKTHQIFPHSSVFYTQ